MIIATLVDIISMILKPFTFVQFQRHSQFFKRNKAKTSERGTRHGHSKEFTLTDGESGLDCHPVISTETQHRGDKLDIELTLPDK